MVTSVLPCWALVGFNPPEVAVMVLQEKVMFECEPPPLPPLMAATWRGTLLLVN